MARGAFVHNHLGLGSYSTHLTRKGAPDGHFLADGRIGYENVGSAAKDLGAPGIASNEAAFEIISADGRITRGPVGEVRNPSWSADGRQVVYHKITVASQPHLWTKAFSRLTGFDLTITEPMPSFTRQGDTLAYSATSKDRISFTTSRDGNFEIYTIEPDGTGLRRLTNSPGVDGHQIWSPDGEWIMFSSARKGFKDERTLLERIPQPYGELFVMRADGSELRQLTDNQWEDATPGWAPEPPATRSSSRR